MHIKTPIHRSINKHKQARATTFEKLNAFFLASLIRSSLAALAEASAKALPIACLRCVASCSAPMF